MFLYAFYQDVDGVRKKISIRKMSISLAILYTHMSVTYVDGQALPCLSWVPMVR